MTVLIILTILIVLITIRVLYIQYRDRHILTLDLKRIDITKKDIENGKKLDIYNCPVVLATQRVLGDNYTVTVGGNNITVRRGNKSVEILLDNVTQNSISRFDHGQEIEPFVLEMNDKDSNKYEKVYFRC